ncbi:hypothetical protein DUI87_31665 [Hirundo rustica rustica]|uniref:G-protein coupled receptors family 1 profile domain-containing protein n=1 Tax=Hirundo rustica rustica TaxID=333673 RepID=A0A3M0IU04_HIRRU|nr:hypothetical protein DUI87_31665 [Hirundo rustica rustica]
MACCPSTMPGCLAGTAGVGPHWHSCIQCLQELSGALSRAHGTEHVLLNFHPLVRDALRQAQINGAEASEQTSLAVTCSVLSAALESLVRGDTFSFLVHTGPHGQPQQMSNSSSSISHFLLLALADTRQLQLLHFCLFLGISLAALLGSGLIISAAACGHHLHTPMFFFLLNLALTDLGSICTTVPKAMHNSLWDTRTISYS